MADSVLSLRPDAVPVQLPGLAPSVGFRLARGIAWTALGSATAQGGSLLSVVIVARTLGKAAYGQFALISSTAVAITAVASLGLGITATKYVSEYRGSDRERVGRVLALSSGAALFMAAAFALAVLMLAPWLALGDDSAAIVPGIRWTAIYVFFITLNGFQLGAMAGFEAFRAIAIANLIYGLAALLLTWLLTSASGLHGAVIAQGVSAFLLWLQCRQSVRVACEKWGIPVSYRTAWREAKVLIDFSVPSAICGIVATVAMWFCNATLVTVKGYGELAVFTAVNNLRSVILFVPALVSRVSMPLLNNLSAGDHRNAYRRTFRGVVVLNGAVAAFLAGTLGIAGPALLHLFGRDFAASPVLFAIFLSSVVLEVLANTLFQALFTSGRIWRNLAIIATWAAVLTGSVVFTSHFGALGVAISYFSAWSFSLTLYAIAAVQQRLRE